MDTITIKLSAQQAKIVREILNTEIAKKDPKKLGQEELDTAAVIVRIDEELLKL